ncbi:MAG: Fe-S cluster assembly protein SufD [Acidimicrobiales bacterium]
MYPVDTAVALPGPGWLQTQREEAAKRMADQPLPTFELEEWRYSPIDDLDPSAFAPAANAPDVDGEGVVFEVDQACASIATVDGFVVAAPDDLPSGLSISVATDLDREVDLGEAVDVFGDANLAFSPTPLVIKVDANTDIDGPVVITHHVRTSGVAAFPHTLVDVGSNASISVVEVLRSEDVDALVVPVTRIDVADAARVRYQQVQELGPRVWQLGSLVADVGGQAEFVGGVAAMGGGYGRLRTDCRLTGRGASGDLLAVYFGDGDQTLDFRTFQDHLARDTTSNLLFKGVLDDSSTSIYTGLIRVAPDAPGTNAFQTNRNIKLSEDAWAESVPNLEIENNDVRCSHASTVSPVDEDQRFYLESRGVPTQAAERLIVEGFLDEVVSKLAVPAVAPHVSGLIQAALDSRES